MAIYSEGYDPKKFGFNYKDFNDVLKRIYRSRELLRYHRESRYVPIQESLRNNYTLDSVEKNLKWFYKIEPNRIGDISFYERIMRKIKRTLEHRSR